MEFTKPSLTEFDTRYYIRHSLKESRKFKDKYITIFVNILFFLIFVFFLGGILLYKYKGKLTPQEKKNNEEKKKQYIFQKLHQHACDKQMKNQSLITNLPLM